jgi:hypothetical protein
MKKFLLVLSIGVFTLAFAACNNSASTEAKADSTKTDSSKMASDSSKMATDSTKMATDTTKKDSTKK